MGKVRYWTEAEVKKMIELFDNGNGLNYREIGEVIGREKSTVRKKLVDMGIAKIKNKVTTEYYYNVGEIVNNELKIIEQTRVTNRKNNIRGYLVQSLMYPTAKQYVMSEYDLRSGQGDAYKSGNRTCEENSLYSNNNARPYLVDIEQAKQMRPYSDEKVLVKCDTDGCNITGNMRATNLSTRGFSCPLCSKSISYGNLAFGSYNKHFKLGFESEKILPKLPNRRVDFINFDNGMWIEVQGSQHTNKNSNWYEDAHAQDVEKRAFAKNNTQYNLIEIDMRISSWEYFKKQINKCEYLPSINDEDEKAILKLMENNKRYPIKKILELYKENPSGVQVADTLKISYKIVLDILRKSGVDIVGKRKDVSIEVVKEIVSLYTEKELSAESIGKIFNYSPSFVQKTLNDNGVTLRPRGTNQYDTLNIIESDVIEMYQKGIGTDVIANKYNCSIQTIYRVLNDNNIKIKGNGKKIRCLNTGVVYESLADASRQTGINADSIGNCISGRSKSAGKSADGTKLVWEFVTVEVVEAEVS